MRHFLLIFFFVFLAITLNLVSGLPLPVVMGFAVLGASVWLYKSRKEFSGCINKKNVIPALLVLSGNIVAGTYLYKVHYNYSGPIQYQESRVVMSENLKNPFPFFVDEWNAIKIAKERWDLGGRHPENNPLLFYVHPMNDRLVYYHSFVSALLRAFTAKPEFAFVPMGILLNLLILTTLMLIVFRQTHQMMISVASGLLLLTVPATVFSPGFLVFIAVNLGFLFLCMQIHFYLERKSLYQWLSFTLLSAFYPPLCVFGFLLLCMDRENFRFLRLQRKTAALIVPPLLLAFAGLVATNSMDSILSSIINRLWYDTMLGEGLTLKASFFKVFPWVGFLLLPGIFWLDRRQKRAFMAIVLPMACLWIFYSFTTKRIWLDFERLIWLTSCLLILFSAISWADFLKALPFKDKYKSALSVVMAFLVAGFSLHYFFLKDSKEIWKSIDVKRLSDQGGKSHFGLPLQNHILSPEEYERFNSYKDARYSVFSLPMKSSLIVAATHHRGIWLHQGSVDLRDDSELKFHFERLRNGKACGHSDGRQWFYKGVLVYLPFEIDCPGLEKVWTSMDVYHLYEYRGENTLYWEPLNK